MKKLDELQLKMDAIEEKVGEMDREPTEAEKNRFYKYKEEQDDLVNEYNEIQNAIDYLSEYCEW